ncbi:SAV_2336 N-terminal domain-related protein [Streptomyces guryensis]|uniref:Protein kinase n=1 Tax=Streptomyces guryensis TaxID=2886947 RepID=A0A9Q3VIZ3_9ACTN|nr:SAV_2336 N-terminal domain-related protein [Streptomyces guryensis]MCD9872552.1 protein kinase [Streptomyces guryensis]
MPSEPSGAPEPLARLADVLTQAAEGTRPTPLELAELLWLAAHMEPADESAPPPAPEPPAPDTGPTDTAEPPPPPRPHHHDPAPTPPSQPRRVPLHLPGPGPATKPHATLLAPAPPMLRHPLALQRSLRPLKRRIDAPVRLELDERATADRIARLGAAPEWWLPVMRPAQERWLRLNLVYDDGPTMPVWRPLVHELHTALAQSGIFRTVGLHHAGPDGTVHRHGGDAPADGRTVTLLVSDCMGPQWREGPAGSLWYGVLRRWARRMPLAVVQPLPEHLWADTALPTVPGRLSAPYPAAPTTALAFTPYDTTVQHEGDGAIALPVLEPGPEWLANWAALIATPGGTEHPASAALLTGPLPADADDRTDVARLSAEELVLRFRATASAEAVRLAGHLALGRPDLSVMRLVHATLEPRPRPQHLAEVILSGMLTTVPGPPGSYAFRPGVRDLLLRGLPRRARAGTSELLARIGKLIDDRAGSAPGEFQATAPAVDGTPRAVDAEAFATVSPDSARQLTGEGGRTPSSVPGRLGTRYRVVRRLGPTRSLWQAQDTEENRTVVLRLHEPITDPARSAAFLRDARLLRDLNQRNVVTVHDFGIEDGVPYVVMEHLDGLALNSLAAPNGYRLPAPLTVSLGWQLAQALGALHEAGFAHIGLDMTKVLLLPDGTAKLTLLPLERTTEQDEYSADLRTLGQLLFHLASGHPRGDGTPVAPDHLTGLPVQLRTHFASALDALLSGELDNQRGGLGRLQHPTLLSPLATAHARLHYALLGPPAVDRGEGRPLAIGSPQEQAMLCMLLLHHGRRVTRAELTEGIWGPKAPERADALLGTYASRLRNAVGPGVLATLSDGYAVHTSTDIVDVIHCQQLVAEAEKDRALGRVELAHRWVNEALGLWHGETALDGVPGPAAAAARTRLLQLRLGLYRTRAELDLDVGEFEMAATSLERLVGEYPSREDFRRLYLIALKGQGRIEEALEVYEEYRLSGGTNPELRLLGRELREEFGETPEDEPEPEYEPGPDQNTGFGLFAPDETPEGSFRPEDLPSLLYLDEESASPSSHLDVESAEASPAYGGFARYDLADGPQDRESLPALGRAVMRLITASGLEETRYRQREGEKGYAVSLDSGAARPLLVATMVRLADRLVELGGTRLQIAFRATGDEEPDEAAARHLLDTSGARGIIAVSAALRAELGEADGSTPALRPLTLDPAAGWYLLIHLPRTAYDGTPPPSPALGPYPLTATRPLPAPHGRTRNVVFALPGGEFSLARTPEAHSYYEVDLTIHHTGHQVSLPSHGGGAFAAFIELSWHVDDPVAFVRGAMTGIPERLLAHVTEEARRITRRHPLARAGAAQSAVRDALRHWPVPGLAVACSIRLTAPGDAPGTAR